LICDDKEKPQLLRWGFSLVILSGIGHDKILGDLTSPTLRKATGNWSPPATPKIHDCKCNLHRNISLRTATGSSHPSCQLAIWVNSLEKQQNKIPISMMSILFW
jgi:hypothetical protein